MEQDSENPDNQEEYTSHFKPSYVIVAIDTHCSMFKSDGQPTPFKNCINALYRLSDFLLLKSDKRGWSPFSVCLYDKDEKASLVNFKDNMIKTTKLLKLKSNLSEEELKNEYMRDSDLDLAYFFQFCKKKFKDISTKFYRRILIFITNDPDPVVGDASKRFTALQEAKNFEENDINFQLVVTNEEFEYDKFYTELFSLVDKPQEIICEDEEGLFEKIISTICFRHSQRKLRFYPFADDFTKSMTVIRKGYIKKARILNNNFVAKDGTLVKRTKKPSSEQMPSHVSYILRNRKKKKKFYEQKFSEDEKKGANPKRFPVGYTLLYVCQRLRQKGEVIKKPEIVEADAREELPYFNQFWQYCINNDKVLICAKVMKKGASPKPVELIPKLVHNTKVFLDKVIAYANEYFEPEIKEGRNEEKVVLTEEQINVTDALIKQLTFEFQSSLLINKPYLNKVNYLKSKLLEEDRNEVRVRELLSREEIDDKIADIADDFLKCFPPEKGVKRKRTKK